MKAVLNQGKLIDKIFEISILTKAAFGFFEIIGGILLTISNKIVVNNFIIYMAQQEIADDPDDLIANYLIKLANDFSLNTHIFAIIYLIFHGAVNIFLFVYLMKGKLWAYPASIALFGIFVVYQVYRFFHGFSLVILTLIIFDIFIMSAIWLEYKRHKNRMKNI